MPQTRKRRAKLVGTWWLPERPETKVRGTLSWAPSSFPALRTERGLIPTDQTLSHSMTPVIHGKAGSWNRITLLQCHSTHLPSLKERYRVEDALLGAHITDGLCQRAMVTYPYLEEWAIGSRWYDAGAIKRLSAGGQSVRIRWRGPSRLSAETSWGRIQLVAGASIGGSVGETFSIKRSLVFHLDASTPRTLQEWKQDIVQPLTNLLSLLTATLTRPRHILLLNWTGESDLVSSPGPVAELVSYERQPDVGGHFRGRVMPVSAMPLPLKDIERRLPRIARRWWEFYRRFPFLCGLFFSVHNDTQGFWEYRFLTHVQAAELYHRLRVKKDELSAARHEARLAAILANTPERYHSWLKDRLSHSNELSLRRRLRSLFEQAKPLLGPLVPDTKQVIDAIVRRRNEFVHGTEDFRLAGPGRYGAFRVVTILSLVLQYLFLREAGLGRHEAVTAMARTFEHDYAKRLEAETRTSSS
jgi:ApeA N-terminal domain 1